MTTNLINTSGTLNAGGRGWLSGAAMYSCTAPGDGGGGEEIVA